MFRSFCQSQPFTEPTLADKCAHADMRGAKSIPCTYAIADLILSHTPQPIGFSVIRAR